MRAKAFVVSVIMAGAIIPASSAAASAQTSNNGRNESETQEEVPRPALISLLAGSEHTLALDEWLARDKPEAEVIEQPTIHTVQDGETLSSIAKQHDTKWLRLWQKNAAVAHADKLTAGDKLTVPDNNEELKPRELPAPPVIEQPEEVAADPKPVKRQPQEPANTRRRARQERPMAAGLSAGNRYTPGYCTWYVKNKRPDLPNSLGNADTWVSRAAAQGLATGSTPRAGAVGQRGMHVAYVERVNPDGTVFVSEMNHKGLWIISSRTVPANYFTYVY